MKRRAEFNSGLKGSLFGSSFREVGQYSGHYSPDKLNESSAKKGKK